MRTDLLGQRFGRLTVIEREEMKAGEHNVHWKCLCDCGITIISKTGALRHGIKQHCGCLPDNNTEMVGRRFLKLVVTSCVAKDRWICQCDCGNSIELEGRPLRSGNTKSCGCLRKQVKPDSYKHGLGNYTVRCYRIWRNMKQRCLNKNNPDYHLYGGRGIEVCLPWAEDFTSFHEWSQNNGYADDLQLDRIDGDGPYAPENCRWVTPRVNSWNKKGIRKYKIEGKMMPVTEIAEKFKVERHTLEYRLEQGLSIKDALNLILQPYP